MVAALTGGDAAGSGIALFEPRDAYRFHSVTSSFSLTADPTTGENPQYGAAISYWIGEGPSEEGEDDSATEVSIRIENQAGETVRTLSGTANPGINRMWWNLRGEPATPLRLRTKPQFADWLTLGPERVREIEGGAAILQLPGSYTVVLEAGESEHRQPLTVIKDPYSEGAAGDIAAQIATLEEIRGDIDTVAGMINRVEWVRRQLIDLQQVLADSEDSEELATATDELLGTLTSVQAACASSVSPAPARTVCAGPCACTASSPTCSAASPRPISRPPTRPRGSGGAGAGAARSGRRARASDRHRRRGFQRASTRARTGTGGDRRPLAVSNLAGRTGG